jgi:hypothetical protein
MRNVGDPGELYSGGEAGEGRTRRGAMRHAGGMASAWSWIGADKWSAAAEDTFFVRYLPRDASDEVMVLQ